MKQGSFDQARYNLSNLQEYDPYHAFVSAVPFMVDMARYSADNMARSYRGFHVGAALFALATDQSTGILTDGNKKLNPHSEKICAEKSVLLQAEINGYDQAIGLVIAGTSDAELIKGVTGKATPTLHPCDSCRGLLEASPIVSDDTLIVTVGVDSDAHQTHTFAELQSYYKESGGENIGDAHFHEDPNFKNWNIRQYVYDYMVSDAKILETSNVSRAEIARMALSGVFLG